MVEGQTSTVHVGNISNEVVERIAELADVGPLELTPPLYDVIDPSALDQIFASTPTAGRMEGHVTFSYLGYDVTVSGDGSVSIEEREE